MTYKVQLIYFRPTGKFLSTAETTVALESIAMIWDEVHEMRRLGRLPGLRPNAGRDLLIVVDVRDHPQRVLHLVMPPLIDEDDVTPVRIPIGEPSLEKIPRTTTRDIVKPVDADGDTDSKIPDVAAPISKSSLDET